MSQQIKHFFVAVAVLFAAHRVTGFTPIMPLADWQVEDIGYNPFGEDNGGPASISEEYRLNVPTLVYGYDESFANFFGAQGIDAMEKTIAILNALPPVSQLSSNLTEYPTDSRRVNFRASALGLLDLKSYTLAALLEQLGLACPERYVWTLRNKNADPVVYLVIKRNYDPVTFNPSSYVNGTLYTYTILDPVYEAPEVQYADAYEVQVDPLQLGFTSVASGFGSLYTGINPGDFYTGLTRDDVGGLRFLYRPNNYQYENLLEGVSAAAGTGGTGSPWVPIGGTGATNSTTTNTIVDAAIRPGVDKITFQRGVFDSLIGNFIVTTNVFTDRYVSNFVLHSQSVQRVLDAPDILFVAEDLGIDADGYPVWFQRTDTANWQNNDALNGQGTANGPGVIVPPIIFRYSSIGPYFINSPDTFLDEYGAVKGAGWADFDGSTNPPVVFPDGYSVQWLESQIFYGSAGGGSSPWTVANSTAAATNEQAAAVGGGGVGGGTVGGGTQ